MCPDGLYQFRRGRDPVAVMRVGHRVYDGHRPGERDFERALGMRAGGPRLGRVDAAAALERPGDARAIGLVAVVADAHPHLFGKVDAVEVCEKAVDEMLARHLAVADDVDAGILLQFDCKQRGIELALCEVGALQPPLRPQLVRLGEPGRFRQAAGDGRRKQHCQLIRSNRSGGRQLESQSKRLSSFSPPIARIATLRMKASGPLIP